MREDIQALQVFIDTIVGVERFSYPARQNSPRPTDGFAVISLLTEKAVGLPNSLNTKETIETTTRTIYSPSLLRFRVGVVETTGMESHQIMHGWFKENIKNLMIKSGYGFVDCQPISLEDAKLENFWEARQGFSIELYVTRQQTEVVDNITSMVIGGEYITPDFKSIALEYNLNP